ncbi:MAG: enoyl-CoA hydratase/isomerase family protein [Chitinispirillaceae bacterium]|nr:enoyl-CoA hydratase/isomerase family protein [Chitinispirillaceae bacterium]
MTYEHIILAIEGGVATVTINRPRAFNVLNSSALQELKSCFLDELDNNDAVKAVILTGKGEKAFCGGADIKEMKGMDAFQAADFSQSGQRIMAAIEDMLKPVIAAVNGYALGGGLELALACDIVIAAENARFASPEINVGIMAGWGASKRLPEAIGTVRAKELLFTGAMIDAQTAFRLGFVNRVVPLGRLNEEAMSLARQLAEKPPIALELAKRAVNHSLHVDRESAELIESEAFGACFATADQKEGMAAFEEKRKPKFIGK